MKKIASGALLIGLFVACGSDGGKKIHLPDGGVDALGVCNPLTQAGCATGEKCTWLLDAISPQYVGHIGCAPDGTANNGDSCMYGAPGETGYDGCKKGSICGNYRGGTGVCKQVCDNQGGNPMCDDQHVCVVYSKLFSTDSTTPPAGGVCDKACDPLADNDFDGSGALTRTGTTCGAATVGCYGYPSFGTPPKTGWSCTNDIDYNTAQPVGFRHRIECNTTNMCGDADAPTGYVNSCNQGYLPLLYDATGSMKVVCVSMCKPKNCYMGNCGTSDVNAKGDPTHNCTVTTSSGSFNTTANGDQCQYEWYYEIDYQGTGELLTSPTSDTLGFCYDHSKYTYKAPSNNMTYPIPPCSMLGDGFGSGSDTTPTAYFGAADLGCVDTTHIPMAAKSDMKSLWMKRASMDVVPRAMYHRTMGTK